MSGAVGRLSHPGDMPRDTHSKSTDVWLLAEDEVVQGEHMNAVLAEAAWRCSQFGRRGLHTPSSR